MNIREKNTKKLDYRVKDIKKTLKAILWVVVITPIIFGQLFHLAQVLEQNYSEYQCILTPNDYLLWLAIKSGRESLTTYMPFSLWSMLNIFIMQIILAIIFIYEIHVLIVNRKKEIKESLFKNNKKAMLRFFSVLLLLYTVSESYISVKQPQALQETSFVSSQISDRENFFIMCGGTGDIKVGEKSKLIKKEIK